VYLSTEIQVLGLLIFGTFPVVLAGIKMYISKAKQAYIRKY